MRREEVDSYALRLCEIMHNREDKYDKDICYNELSMFIKNTNTKLSREHFIRIYTRYKYIALKRWINAFFVILKEKK